MRENDLYAKKWRNDASDERIVNEEKIVEPPEIEIPKLVKSLAESERMYEEFFQVQVDNHIKNPSIFTITAVNFCAVEQKRKIREWIHLSSASILAVFLMLFVTSTIFLSVRTKLRCTSEGSLRNRLTATALFIFLYLSLNSSLQDSRTMVYFSSFLPIHQRLVLLLGALIKILCCASVLAATYVLFITHPTPDQILVNGFALNFLIDADLTISSALRTSPFLVSFFRHTTKILHDLSTQSHLDATTFTQFANFHTKNIRQKMFLVFQNILYRNHWYLAAFSWLQFS
uniref:Uncharacterized protein n=1 Tax=Aureoumbra lagunensis TaxID=44058 RepID=A0A7S3NJ39_9STRA|mmetsp:Transcript_7741/g.10783  ORF Transcript_7741/g.10783 Transcript_7741/m.10783 type:complete len:287 (+) Transcript_7741:143-1003(+)